MRTSKYMLSTLKEIPSDTEVISYQLMLRAGMIRKLSSGIYSWLPTGLRVLRKTENIVREEMDNIGAIEVSMPIVQPADLWKKSGRWIEYGPELLRFNDRGARSFVLAPTHEEVITYLIHNEIRSYKQLPINFYQIQTKFRDEVRPRFGVMRSREFIMKDAYSFHTSQNSLQETYDIMYQAYKNIFNRMGLEFCVVQADSGPIGGTISHEFLVLATNGEKDIVFSTSSDYIANIELAEAVAPTISRTSPSECMRLVDTPAVNTITELISQFSIPLEKTIKMFLVRAHESVGYPLVALIIRGDHELNSVKAEKLSQVYVPLTFANKEEIRLAVGTDSRFLGPINFPLPIFIDRSVALMSDFVAGANADGKHFFGINWERDVPLPPVADLRKVVDGDISQDGNDLIKIRRGIEIGHIFQLGTKYSDAMKATVQFKNGQNQALSMGCYGIGITRLVAAIIENNHDDRGITWPEAIAPFNVAILPISIHKSFKVKEVAEKLYNQLQIHGIDVIFDDRKERPGVMFSDIELIGVPHQLVISERNLNTEEIEYKNRRSNEILRIKLNSVIDFLIKKISNSKLDLIKFY